VPRAWPPLTAGEIADCLTELGWVHDRDNATHQVWVHETTHKIAVVDVKWQPVSGPMLKHLITEELHLTREQFYGATKTTRKKIGLR
jgi:predicted RNA binding protein YcfA (HicA-like mRNA interferase family)